MNIPGLTLSADEFKGISPSFIEFFNSFRAQADEVSETCSRGPTKRTRIYEKSTNEKSKNEQSKNEGNKNEGNKNEGNKNERRTNENSLRQQVKNQGETSIANNSSVFIEI